jgi:hypothetical protein
MEKKAEWAEWEPWVAANSIFDSQI